MGFAASTPSYALISKQPPTVSRPKIAHGSPAHFASFASVAARQEPLTFEVYVYGGNYENQGNRVNHYSESQTEKHQ